MKQQLVADIKEKFSTLGIQAQYGQGTDISISTEFLNAGWSTGKKKINYESNIFLDEQEKTIFMFEKTREEGHGFSFGGESESTFQSGTTLFRKVKSVQYGPDGKAYEITLDLGSVPKAVKETAKQYGWKFKTVLKKNKAMYPAGYVAGDTPKITEQTPKQSSPQQKSKINKIAIIMLCLLGVIFLGLFALMGTRISGWILGSIILFTTGFLIRKFGSKGCLTSALILIITAVIMSVILIFTIDTDKNNKQKVTDNLTETNYTKISLVPPEGFTLINNTDSMVFDHVDNKYNTFRAVVNIYETPKSVFDATEKGIDDFFESMDWEKTDYKIIEKPVKKTLDKYTVVECMLQYNNGNINRSFFVDIEGKNDVWIQLGRVTADEANKYASQWEETIKTIKPLQ